jgi:hypothetical protein
MLIFTAEEVRHLNDWQQSGIVHPFTCGRDHDGPRELIATGVGWICPSCDYRQDWAHDFMKDGTALAEQRALVDRMNSQQGKARQ